MEFKRSICASLLAGNWLNIGHDIKRLEEYHCERLHYDMMDGYFVNNISTGVDILQQISSFTKLPIDCHIMVNDPLKWVNRIIKAGAYSIIFHFEACYYREIKPIISAIQFGHCKAGIAISPGTNVEQIYEYLSEIDVVLIMTVEPGKGGQACIPACLDKITKLVNYRLQKKLEFHIMVDGGMNSETITTAMQNGANLFVVGNYLFNNLALNLPQLNMLVQAKP